MPSRHETKLALARELVDDIELSRLQARATLLKTSRLARLHEAIGVEQWTARELRGYEDSAQAREHMSTSGRWTDFANGLGFWISLPQIETRVLELRSALAQLRVPDVSYAPSSSNPHELVTNPWTNPMLATVNAVIARQNAIVTEIAQYDGIITRVISICHAFAVMTLHALEYGGVAESVFEEMRADIDRLLGSAAGTALERLSSIAERLRAGDGEAVSQAMNSCRRVIKAVVDAVYPSSSSPVTLDGETYGVGDAEVLNRHKLFLRRYCESQSRVERLAQGVRRIWERASAGAHADVSPDEARALFLQMYMALGETLSAAKSGGWQESGPPAGGT